MSKYKNKKTTIGGITFDSKKEARRYEELAARWARDEIDELRLQVPFQLIPKQTDENGKVIERACKYVADFVYLEDGEVVVEDTKGKKTPEYIIKRKLMLKIYGIRIKEL